MTDPIIPEKLRELADDLECGEGGILLAASVAAEVQAALNAAADEIEDSKGGSKPQESPLPWWVSAFMGLVLLGATILYVIAG